MLTKFVVVKRFIKYKGDYIYIYHSSDYGLHYVKLDVTKWHSITYRDFSNAIRENMVEPMAHAEMVEV